MPRSNNEPAPSITDVVRHIQRQRHPISHPLNPTISHAYPDLHSVVTQYMEGWRTSHDPDGTFDNQLRREMTANNRFTRAVGEAQQRARYKIAEDPQ